MLLQRRRVFGALASAILRPAVVAASLAPVFLVAGVGSASASTFSACGPTGSGRAANAAPPTNPFGPNVTIFNPSESVSTINAALNATTSPRNAPREFFFLPGTYGSASATPSTATTSNTIDAQVASGTIVAGLGASPCDVLINGALDIPNDGLAIRPSQLENLTINPIESGDPADTMTWFTSQNATWRRVNLLGNLNVDLTTPAVGLCTNPCTGFAGAPPPADQYAGQANGFEIANSNITGDVVDTNGENTLGVPGDASNSDLYIQDSHIGGFEGFGSDMVFAGVDGAPASNFGQATASRPPGDIDNVATVPVVRESPFVYYNSRTNQFQVFDPSVQFDRRGYDWSVDDGWSLPLSSFYIANSASDTAETLNAALTQGKNLLLTPGSYTLDEALTVPRHDEMVFGLGESTLTADNGTATLVVNDAATGAVLAGFNANGPGFDPTASGPFPADQIVIGNTPNATGWRDDPTTLTDVSTVSDATTDELINQNDVLLNQAEIQTNNNGGNGYTLTNWPAQSSGDYGAVVNGDDVTWEGIWLEHFKMTEATWNGQGGQVLFLENELPLTVPFATDGVQSSVWMENANFDGYPSLAVSPRVRSFALSGMQSWSRFGNGCYCLVSSLITTPVRRHVTFHDIFSGLILGTGAPGATPSDDTVGGVLNVINNDGVSAYVPYDASWAGTSAFPHSDLYGHEVTVRLTDFPSQPPRRGSPWRWFHRRGR
jgi:hypothetical protein